MKVRLIGPKAEVATALKVLEAGGLVVHAGRERTPLSPLHQGHVLVYADVITLAEQAADAAIDKALNLASRERDQARKERKTMLRLLGDLVDRDDCWFDHHGGCQAHGYLSLAPGERCPHQEAKELLGDVAGVVFDAG